MTPACCRTNGPPTPLPGGPPRLEKRAGRGQQRERKSGPYGNIPAPVTKNIPYSATK
jgi:hypothetical protein